MTDSTTTAVKPFTPSFDFVGLQNKLAAVEKEASNANADAAAIRGEKSSIAVQLTILAFEEKLDPEAVREALLAKDVLKGTASKIVTILNALNAGNLAIEDVKSLSGAYNAIKNAGKPVDKNGKPVKVVTEVKIKEVSVPAKYTKKGAIDYLIALVSDEPDVDKALRLSRDIITAITRELTKVSTAKVDKDDETEAA